MLKNYLLIAIRNLFRQKMYSVINILGLAIGLACSITIFLYVTNELSYDTFHEKAEKIFRITMQGRFQGQELNDATTPAPMAPTMVSEIPEVENAVRVDYMVDVYMRYEDKAFQETNFWAADSTFFEVFTVSFVEGNPETALKKPETLVITTETAQRYFGDENPLGKLINVHNDTTFYEVTGVIEPFPANSHIQPDMLASFHTWEYSDNQFWLNNSLTTYIVLNSPESREAVEEKLDELVKIHVGEQLQEVLNVTLEEFEESGNTLGYSLQPLLDIHFEPGIGSGTEAATDKATILIFIAIAVFIMLIASVNFMNLSTARSANRAKEVGIRKVLGAHRKQLIRQFLAESIVISFVAMLLAIVFVELSLPFFNQYINLELELSYLSNWYMLPVLILLTILVGLLSGSYPAFFLSAFKPVTILKGKFSAGAGGKNLRRGLVVFQFIISIGIMLTTFVIYKQLDFFLNKDMGFDKDQIMVIQRAGTMDEQQTTFRDEIKKHPGVIDASCSVFLPGYYGNNSAMRLEGRDMTEQVLFAYNYTDPYFLSTYGIELKSGRFLTNQAADSSNCVINEAAARILQLDEPMGKYLIEPGPTPAEERKLKIVGVVKDYNYNSLHNSIGASVFVLREAHYGGVVNVRLAPDRIDETVAFLESKWNEFTNNQPLGYLFLNEEFKEHYQTEIRISKVLVLFTIFSVIIAALGLYGLIAFAASQRTREIGIRKTLGSSNFNILVLLSRETLILILVAAIIATPLAYFGTQQWLQNIPPENKISISALWFVLVIMVTFLIAIATIIYQALKAASINPAAALKYE